MSETAIESVSPTVDVGMGEWAKLENTGKLETYGLGFCIGVAVYDTQTRVGYLAHIPSYLYPPTGHRDELTDMLQVIRAKNHQPADLKVWIGGARLGGELLPQPEFNDMLLAKRSSTLDEIAELGVQEFQIGVHWDRPLESLAMSLDCSTGECEFRSLALSSSF